MKPKQLIKKMNYVNEVLNIFTSYSNELDDYFKNEDNQKNNYELYVYYLNLRDRLIECTKKYNM